NGRSKKPASRSKSVADAGTRRLDGNPENALTDDEILEKFFGLANPVIGSARAREIVALVAQLGQSDHALAHLMELALSK
ncbi:MAG: hypothetical protein ABI434_10840, partial [Burkholderiaceae bacterium]